MRSRLVLLFAAALLATLALAAEPAAPAPAPARYHSDRVALDAAQRVIVPLLRLPIELLLSPVRLFDRRPEPGQRVERDSGWTQVGFEVHDYASGLYLKLKGKALLGRVEVVFEDGSLERHDLRPTHEYRAGTYELAQFDRSRSVTLVRMEARAVSDRARVQLILGHPGR